MIERVWRGWFATSVPPGGSSVLAAVVGMLNQAPPFYLGGRV